MRELRKLLFTAVFVAMLSVSTASMAQEFYSRPATPTVNNIAPKAVVVSDATTTKPVTKHAVHKKKKKKTHHASAKKHHKKLAKKSSSDNAHHKKKIAGVAHTKTKLATAPSHKIAEAGKPVPVTRKNLAPVKKSASAAAAYRSSNHGTNNVAYTFCLGYDNCVPTRYETTGTMTRVMQKSPDGEWTEAKIDPIMAADLHELAGSESGGTVIRPLTDAEKSRIADHQGKVHAQLVGYVQGGPETKDQAKALMRELRIHGAADLEAYDPKLQNNPAALEVANELAAEHVPAPGR